MEKIKIWGTGNAFKNFYSQLDRERFQIIALTDSNTQKHNLHINGLPILPSEEWFELECDYIVIASSTYYGEIRKILNDHNMPQSIIFSRQEFAEKVQYKSEIDELVKNNLLFQYFYTQKHRPSTKWIHYFDIYNQHFSKYLGQEIWLCEVA